MKKLLLAIFVLVCPFGHAQTIEWHNPLQSDVKVLQGQGFADIANYSRLPERAKVSVSDGVWSNSRNSAGLSLLFTTNSPQIKVRYTMSGGHAMPHMPATGVSGMDLYMFMDGKWQSSAPDSYWFADTTQYIYQVSVPKKEYRYELFLPLYNSVTWLEIGVDKGASFSFEQAADNHQAVVVYGTSIAHGACASRPGMAWTTILKHKLDTPLINLGFSGWGRLEASMGEMLNEIPARLYIIDCLPNMAEHFAGDTIYERTLKLVHQLRAVHPTTPILLTEHVGFRKIIDVKRSDIDINVQCQKAYAQLKKEGVKNLYYLSAKEMAMPCEGFVDYIHPNDYGMVAYAEAYYKKIKNEIFKR